MTDSYQLQYKECEVSVASLQNQVQVFDAMYSNIRGRSASYNSVTNTTASEFSELISGDIRSAADENEEAWGSALMATVHAVGIIHEYTSAIQTYESKIDELEEELDSAVSQAEGKAEKEALVEEYSDQATTAWESLESIADTVSERLADGPTPEHMRELTEGGHLGGVPGGFGWVITGDDEYFAVPPNMDGSEIGEMFQRAAEEDGPSGEQLDENIALMTAFMSYVTQKQEKGEKLSERELEILDELNGQMDAVDPNESSTTGNGSYENPSNEHGEFFESLQEIKESENLTDEQREDMIAAVGGSVLAGSDESLGGAYENIPESVRDTIEGPKVHSPSSHMSDGHSWDWGGDFSLLTEAFKGATEDNELHGGAEMSATLTGTVAGAVDSVNLGGAEESDLQTMVDLSTQNENANFAVLTGEYPNGDTYEHPVEFPNDSGQTGTNRGELVASLFSHDWDDDGASVRGLTDWIGDGESGVEKNDRAFEGLLNIISDPDVTDSLAGTGNDVEDEGPDGEDFTWKNVPMGLVNPEISDSFADIFETYVHEFSGREVLADEQSIDFDVTTGYDPSSGLTIDMEDRISFTGLIAGDGESMGRMHDVADQFTRDQVHDYFTDAETAENRGAARESGLLWNAVYHGIYDAVDGRFESHNNAISSENETMGNGVDMITSEIPSGSAAQSANTFLKEMFTQDELEGQGGPSEGDIQGTIEAEVDALTKDATLEYYYDTNPGEVDEDGNPVIPNSMVGERGEFLRDPSFWDTDDANNLRDEAMDAIENEQLPPEVKDDGIHGHLDKFQTALNQSIKISPYST